MDTLLEFSLKSYPLIKNVGFVKVKDMWKHPDRIFDFNVFIFVKEGSLEFYEDGKEYYINENETYILKSGIHHWGEEKTKPGTSWYYIHYYDNTPERDYELFNDKHSPIAGKFITPEKYNCYINIAQHIKVDNPVVIIELLEHIWNIYRSGDPYRQFSIGLYTMDLFIKLHRLSGERKRLSKADITVKKIIEYLENYIIKFQKEKINVQDIANELNMNYCYLCNVFKQKTGMGILNYVNKLKIHQATKLLIETNLNISQIADKLGYQNVYYFSRVFKKFMGVSPSEYIKQIYVENQGRIGLP